MQPLIGVDVTRVDTEQKFTLGTIHEVDGKVYKYVEYEDGTGDLDLADGDVVHYVDDSGYGANQVSADVSDLTGDGIPAGVAPAAVTADGSFFWCQIKGAATLAVAIEDSNDGTPVSAADGDPLVLGDADKAVRRENTVIDADAERIARFGVAVDASAKEVIVDCTF